MVEGQENWRLILEAARALTGEGRAPFSRAQVYEWIWKRHPRGRHDRPSLDPTFQGMITNAPGGPSSAGGTPLRRVDRGLYVLGSTADGDFSATSPVAQANPSVPLRQKVASPPLTEDEVKRAVKAHLEANGYAVTVKWGRDRGVDIEAVSATETLLLEAKGSAVNPPQQVNYFLSAIGELIQRMSDANASYGLALPDNQQFRGLVGRLPALVWSRLRFTVFFVAEQTDGYVLDRLNHHAGLPGK